MTLQSSGTIRLSEIRDEFGANINGVEVSLGRYRNSDSNFSNKNVGTLTDLPLDTGVPRSGTISASSFYSKKLNVVVDLFSQANNTTRQNIRGRWNSNEVRVVGGYRSRPSSGANVRVIANINKTIGSQTGSNHTCAVRTGYWESFTTLELEVGNDGRIYGAGGNGGDGGSAGNGGGQNGTVGTSALGIEYPCSLNNLGRIQSGYGGGGGGSGRQEYRRSGKKGGRWVGSSGGGGGGGAGFPTSTGGDSPSNAFGGGSNGSDGANGSNEASGGGGAGGASAGAGGAGGAVNNSSTAGSNGAAGGPAGGTGGNNGYAIVTLENSLPSISGNAVIGRTITSTSPD